MKLPILLFTVFSLLQVQFATSQEIQARVIDAQTKQPIPYANVVFGENKGVVTNEEGYFSFNFGQKKPESVRISSLGYELLEMDPAKIRDAVIALSPSSIELKEVFLSNKNLSAREILEKVKEEVPNNYEMGMGQKRIFFRESYFNNIKKFSLKVDESTIPGIDQDLMDQITSEMPKHTDSYREVLGDLYGNYDSQKLNIVKAANLYDPNDTRSVEELTDKMEELFRKNLKEKSFLKIKSGWFGVKIDEEELEEGMAELEEQKKEEKTPGEIAEKEAKSRKYVQDAAVRYIKSMMSNVFWKEDINFNLFEKTRKYELNLKGYLHLEDATVYVIEFEPKRNADYKGTVYVNTLDYGVHRLDFENVKPLKKFRLFGISTSNDLHRGKMIFTRNDRGKYSVSYLEQEKGETIGIDRPLTIIEKNRHVPGRNKQNELDMDLDLRFGQIEKTQMLIYDDEPINNSDYEALQVQEDFEFQVLKAYDPEFWKGHNIIEPNAAIKEFTAIKEN